MTWRARLAAWIGRCRCRMQDHRWEVIQQHFSIAVHRCRRCGVHAYERLDLPRVHTDPGMFHRVPKRDRPQ